MKQKDEEALDENDNVLGAGDDAGERGETKMPHREHEVVDSIGSAAASDPGPDS